MEYISGIFALAGVSLTLFAQYKTRQSEEKRWVLQHNLKLKNDSLYQLYLQATHCYLTLTTYGENPPEDLNEYEKINKPIKNFERTKIISTVFLENTLETSVSSFLTQVDICRNVFLHNIHGRVNDYDFGKYEPDLTKCYEELLICFKNELYPQELRFLSNKTYKEV
jgi:hypothetical protein